MQSGRVAGSRKQTGASGARGPIAQLDRARASCSMHVLEIHLDFQLGVVPKPLIIVHLVVLVEEQRCSISGTKVENWPIGARLSCLWQLAPYKAYGLAPQRSLSPDWRLTPDAMLSPDDQIVIIRQSWAHRDGDQEAHEEDPQSQIHDASPPYFLRNAAIIIKYRQITVNAIVGETVKFTERMGGPRIND